MQQSSMRFYIALARELRRSHGIDMHAWPGDVPGEEWHLHYVKGNFQVEYYHATQGSLEPALACVQVTWVGDGDYIDGEVWGNTPERPRLPIAVTEVAGVIAGFVDMMLEWSLDPTSVNAPGIESEHSPAIEPYRGSAVSAYPQADPR